MSIFSKLFKKKTKTPVEYQADWLIIGLGNPGEKYAATRHNIGWMVIAVLCHTFNIQLKTYQTYKLIEFSNGGKNIAIGLPLTYMNNSGDPVSKLIKLYNLPPEKCIVVVDEYNFPTGRIHLKKGGSDGGHNGISDIINKLNNKEFYRLRCGISKNFPPGGLVDYVLSPFTEYELELRDKMINSAVTALKLIISSDNISKSLSDINSGRLTEN